MVIDPTGLKVPVKFSYSRSNCSLDTRLPHFVANNDNNAGRRATIKMKEVDRKRDYLKALPFRYLLTLFL